jgi:hypothetical protein
MILRGASISSHRDDEHETAHADTEDCKLRSQIALGSQVRRRLEQTGSPMTVSSETLRSISRPDRLERPIATLELVEGVLGGETARLVDDHLDIVSRTQRFLTGYAGASISSIRMGFHEAGTTHTQARRAEDATTT